MSILSKRSVRKKALMAFVFAGMAINPQLQVLAEDDTKTSESLITQIATETEIEPVMRAYFLLRLANAYLTSADAAAAEGQFVGDRDHPVKTWRLVMYRMDKRLTFWADQVASEKFEANSAIERQQIHQSGDSKLEAGANSVLAEAALRQALAQLNLTSDGFAKLNMYFIASMICRKMGDSSEYRKCNDFLERAFRSCEQASADERQIGAATSVLNSMAYGVISIHIGEGKPEDSSSERTPSLAVSERSFKKCEAIRLRALKMADRLAAQSDVRRRIHRDMAIWYMQLGKTEKAEKEKKTLFALVGFEDERVLYPQSGTCGNFIWWHKETIAKSMERCGMG